MAEEEGGGPPKVFISYSRKDDVPLGHLLEHLSGHEQLGLLVPWHDNKVGVGEDWYEEIEEALNSCAVAILLVSPSFLGSKYCLQDEVPVLLERRQRQGIRIVPIFVRHCSLKRHPWLSAIQMRPSADTAMAMLTKAKRDKAYADLVDEIDDFLESDEAKSAVAPNQPVASVGPQPKADSEYPPIPKGLIDLTRLPTSGFDVVGRERELEFLNEALDGAELNVVSLRAWGGVGKSTLVNKWCEYLAADNFRGATRVFAWSFYSQGTNERVTSADAFIDEALRFFGDDDPTAGSPWSKGERLAALVGEEKALLILDGMEPLQDEHQGIKDPALARLVECLAEENAGLCMITTREPVREFADFPETTEEVDLEQLSKEAGGALLRIKGLRAAQDLLEQVSEAFGNHALALNLLASYLKGFAGGDISQALTIPDLPDVTVDDGKHPRRVMAVFAKQFGDGPKLELLRVMGLFDRPADEGCIGALREKPTIPGLTERLSALDEISWRNLLERLHSFGLIAKASHQTSDELDAHPLVREHFGVGLRAQEGEAWKAGHKRLFEHLKTVPKKHQPDSLAEMAPLLQAVYHGCAADRQCEALHEVYYSRILRDRRNYLVKKLGAFGADLGMSSCFFQKPWYKPSTNLDDDDQFWLLNHTGFLLHILGRLKEAFVPTNIGLSGRIETNSWRSASISTRNLCQLKIALGKIKECTHLAESAVSLAEESQDNLERVRSRSILAHVLHQEGKIDTSLGIFEQACIIQGQTEKYSESILLSLQGFQHCELLMDFGRAQDAMRRSAYSLEIAKTKDWPFSAALSNLFLGRVAVEQSEPCRARVLLDQALESLRTVGGPEFVAKSLLTRAALFREVFEHCLSRRDLAEAARITKRCGLRLFECDAHLEYTRLELAQDNPDAALPHFHSADALVTECGYHRRDPEITELKEKLGL